MKLCIKQRICSSRKAIFLVAFLVVPFVCAAQHPRGIAKEERIQSIVARTDSCIVEKEFEAAIDLCKQGLILIRKPSKYLSEYARLNYLLAYSYIYSGRLELGIDVLEKLLSKELPQEDCYKAQLLLGKAYSDVENHPAALKYITYAANNYLDAKGEDKVYWEEYQIPLAEAYARGGESDKASELLMATINYAKANYAYEDYIDLLRNKLSGFVNVESRGSTWADKVVVFIFDELATYYEQQSDWVNYIWMIGIESELEDYLGDFHNAKTLNLKAIEHYTEDVGIPLSSFYSSAARASSRLYYYDEAEQLLEKAEEIAHSEPDSLESLKDIRRHRALLCIDRNENLEYAIEVFSEELTDNRLADQDRATILYNLGLSYWFSNPVKSKECFEDALVYYEKTEGHGILYAKTLNQLGMIAHNEKDYQTALGYYELAIDIFRRLSSDTNYSYILTLKNAAMGSEAMRQYGRAIAFAEEARLIQWNKTGIIFTDTWDLLSRCYAAIHNYRYQDIVEQQLDLIWKDDRNRQLISSLNEVNTSYRLGDVENAIRVFHKADSLFNSLPDSPNKESILEFIEHHGKMLGESSSDLFGYYSNLLANADSLDYGLSLVIKRIANQLYDEGDNNSSYILYRMIFPYANKDPKYLYQAYYSSIMNEDDGFCRSLLGSINSFLLSQLSAAVGLTEEEKEVVWNGVNMFRKLLLASRRNSEIDGYLYDMTLASKGFLLRSDLVLAETIANSNNVLVKEKSSELKEVRYRLHNFKESLAPETRDSLRLREIQLNRDILTTIGDFSNSLILAPISHKEIAKSLFPDEVAIEIVDYPISDSDKQYGALLLAHGDNNLHFIELCKDSDFAQYSNIPIKNAYNAEGHVSYELYKLFWAPIVPYLQGVKHVYIATSGRVSVLPIEAFANDSGCYMEDMYEIERVSSTASVYTKSVGLVINNATIYGGLFYDTSATSGLESGNAHYNSSYTDGYMYDRSRSGDIAYLPWTKTEAEGVTRVLSRKHILTTTITGQYGTEESFKSLSGSNVSLIHIATHGFYQPRERVKRIGFFDSSEDGIIIPSMQRSGLLMAGCSSAWKGESFNGEEDGVLTASEISNLDLSSTSLVVMSACETGLGEITEDGIEGLQRAFKNAGVQSIVMSLWKVDDKATEMLMTEFYANLTKGMTKKDAFTSAKNRLKKEKKYCNPYYWAGFILLD